MLNAARLLTSTERLALTEAVTVAASSRGGRKRT
jgi:hypothetical protein